MQNVGYATLSIVPSAKGFFKDLDREIGGPLGQAGDAGGDSLARGIGGKFRSMIGPLMAAAGAIGVGSFISGTVTAAADLEQSVGAINAIFQDSAGQMLDWSENAAMSVGLAQNEYNELGTIIGAQLANAGVAMDELAPKTDELITLGADLASMFGGTTSDAVGAISAALRGERDTIERYGITLTDAAVRAKAAELGFSAVGGALSAEANQAATVALLMEQAGAAHGNFAREGGTVAQNLQILGALWSDAKARIGTAFLPAVSAATGVLISGFGPALDRVTAGIGIMTTAVGGAWAILSRGEFAGAANFLGLEEDSGVVTFLFNVRDALSGVYAILANGDFVGASNFLGIEEDSALVDFLFTIRDAALSLGPAFAPVGDAFAALAPTVLSLIGTLSPLGIVFQALAPLLPQIATFVASLATMLGGVLGSVLSSLTPLVSTLVTAISSIVAAILPLVTALLPPLSVLFGAIGTVLSTVVAALAPLIAMLVEALVPIITTLVTALAPVIGSFVTLVSTAILPLVNILVSALMPVIEALMPVVTTVFGVIVEIITAAMGIVQGIITTVTGVLTGDWGMAWQGIQQILAGAWDLILAVIDGAIAIVVSLFNAIGPTVMDIWNGLWSWVGTTAKNAWDGMVSGVQGFLGQIGDFFGSIPGRIRDALGDLGAMLRNIATDMMQGFINGASAMAQRIYDSVVAPIQDAVDGVTSFLGINSPSRLMRTIGEFTGEGMALGLERSAGRVASASSALIPAVPVVASPRINDGGLIGAQASTASALGALGDLTMRGQLVLDSGELMGAFDGRLARYDSSVSARARAGVK